jgi:hypothetical protein
MIQVGSCGVLKAWKWVVSGPAAVGPRLRASESGRELTVRLGVVNLFAHVYQIRDGSGAAS